MGRGGYGVVGEGFRWDVADGGLAAVDGVDRAPVDAGDAEAGAGEGDGRRPPDGARADDGDGRGAGLDFVE